MLRRVLLLITHQSYRAEAFLEALAQLGHAVTVGTDREQALAFLNPVGNLTLDFADPRAALAKAQAFHAEHPIDAVLASEDDGVILAAFIAAGLGLPGNPPEAVLDARDKQRSREAWRAAGLPGPAFESFALDEEPASIAARMRYPCVLKPLALSASRGVIRADDPRGFLAAWQRLAAILARPEIVETGGRWARHLLVEDYLPGMELAVEGILTAGQLHPLAIFDKPDPLEGPFFEETIYLTPSRLSGADQRAILEAVQSAALALGLRHGPVHAELRLNEDGPWMLEIAPRSIGGLCGRSLRFQPREAGDGPAWISLEQLILRHALGEAVDGWRRESAASGVMMIPIPRAGILREVNGLGKAGAVADIEEIHMSLLLGSPVEPPPEGAQYLGFIFARAETAAEVEVALRKAHQQLEFVIEPRESREVDPT